MPDEPKLTSEAVTIPLIARIQKVPHVLLLWRTKWESEGTPFIFPGGGVNKGELTIDAAWRELKEETGLGKSSIRKVEVPCEPFKTMWTKKMHVIIMYYKSRGNGMEYPRIKFDMNKFAGFVWMKITSGVWGNLFPVLMPGAKHVYLTTLTQQFCKDGYAVSTETNRQYSD